MSANGGHDDKPRKVCPTTSANDMVISDDDSATVQNKINSTPSLDNFSYSGSDDETIIESDQPLFLDAPVGKSDPILGSDDGVAGEDVAMMAEFLQDTFEPNASGCGHHSQSAASTFGDVLDASEMDALLNAGNDVLMLLPDLSLEV